MLTKAINKIEKRHVEESTYQNRIEKDMWKKAHTRYWNRIEWRKICGRKRILEKRKIYGRKHILE